MPLPPVSRIVQSGKSSQSPYSCQLQLNVGHRDHIRGLDGGILLEITRDGHESQESEAGTVWSIWRRTIKGSPEERIGRCSILLETYLRAFASKSNILRCAGALWVGRKNVAGLKPIRSEAEAESAIAVVEPRRTIAGHLPHATGDLHVVAGGGQLRIPGPGI